MKEKDFWAEHPDAISIEAFRVLKEKQPERSSNLMWYIYCLKSPDNEFLIQLPAAKRIEELKTYFGIRDADIKFKYFQKAVSWFEENCLTRPQRVLNSIYKKLDEAQNIMDQSPMNTPEDIALYNNILKDFGMMKSECEKAEALLKEDKKSRGKLGGGAISAWDGGEL